jgi:hypothetical protein
MSGCLVLGLSFAAGCSSSNKTRIEGTKWERPLATGVSLIEFGTDFKLVVKNPHQTFKGRYELGRGENVTFIFDEEVEGERIHQLKISIDSDTLTMSDKTGTVSFKKVD